MKTHRRSHPFISNYPPVSVWIHLGALLSLLGFLILTKWVFVPDIGTYGDETHKWLHAKMLTGEIPLSEWIWDHHTARLAIMAVTWLVQLIAGSEPMNYFIPAMVACYGMATALYGIGCLIFRPAVGYLAALALLTWLPDMFHQLMPSPFMSWFVLCTFAAILFGLRAHGANRSESGPLMKWMVAAALLHFLAYLSWIGALFFLPVFAIIIWMGAGLRATILYLATLASLYIIETLCYWIFAGIPLGRLEIITWYHMTDMDQFKDSFQPVFLDLFRRYNFLYGYPKKVVIPFLIMLPALFLFWKALSTGIKLTLSVTLCFFFFLTFSVTSLEPLKPFLQHTQPRYSYPLYPLILLIYAGLIASILAWTIRRIRRKEMQIPSWATALIMLICLAGFSFINLYWRFPGYSWTERHAALSAQQELASYADDLDMPIIQLGKATPKGLKYHVDILLDRNTPDGSPRPSPVLSFLQLHARPAWVLIPHGSNLPKERENLTLEQLYHGDIALFVDQRPYRSSIGSVIQVGISPRASGGRTAWLKHRLWEKPIQWLFDAPEYARPGTPVSGSLSEKDNSAWLPGPSASLYQDSVSLSTWRCQGNTEALDTLDFELPYSEDSGSDAYLLVKTGPSTEGLVLAIYDAATGERVFELSSIPVFEENWMLLKLPSAYLQNVPGLRIRLIALNPSETRWLAVSQLIWAEGTD